MLPIEGQPILTAAQMRAAEEAAARTPDAMYALMERAGQGVAEAVRRLAAGAEVLILCGPGNNGGDGYVAARVLAEAGHPVRVAALSEPQTDLARRARAGWSGPVDALDDEEPAPVLVDALFGVGLDRPLADSVAALLSMHRARARLAVAVDLPSGVDADTGGTFYARVPSFDLTLALGALKPAHVLHPAAGLCGTVRLLPLGLDPAHKVAALAPPDLIEPDAATHKFDRGMVAVVAGAMPGAAALAATAAARAGAGYVLLLGSATDRLPHAVVRRSWSADPLSDPRIGAIVIGPGLGRDDRARERLEAALGTDLPLVIDGDALRLLDTSRLAIREAETVLTPHAGEFAQLHEGDGDRLTVTLELAARSGATVVHKGADTVIAAPDGQARMATHASPWLSTAGTGDVLAGAIAAQLASGLSPFEAACAGVWLHAEAARRCGASFIADDLAAALTPARASLCR